MYVCVCQILPDSDLRPQAKHLQSRVEYLLKLVHRLVTGDSNASTPVILLACACNSACLSTVLVSLSLSVSLSLCLYLCLSLSVTVLVSVSLSVSLSVLVSLSLCVFVVAVCSFITCSSVADVPHFWPCSEFFVFSSLLVITFVSA